MPNRIIEGREAVDAFFAECNKAKGADDDQYDQHPVRFWINGKETPIVGLLARYLDGDYVCCDEWDILTHGDYSGRTNDGYSHVIRIELLSPEESTCPHCKQRFLPKT